MRDSERGLQQSTDFLQGLQSIQLLLDAQTKASKVIHQDRRGQEPCYSCEPEIILMLLFSVCIDFKDIEVQFCNTSQAMLP